MRAPGAIEAMAQPMKTTRRDVLRLLAGLTAMAADARPVLARETHIERLIYAARAYPTISQRIAYISAALRGTRYVGYTLIGSSRRPEKFVVRDDGFDCVTFCETVLAAARARNLGDFETVLRQVRYYNGVVEWRERNHYFFEWGEHNVANQICRPLVMPGAVLIEKTVNYQKGLGTRHFTMTVIPRAAFLAHKNILMDGDIIGFVTHRPNLDYFHVGFVMFGRHRKLLLRHAAKSRRRVFDEDMERFIAFNRVGYVTLLRPLEPKAVA
jgi:N-acetylmuramoyl-L-alanine amidase-like